MTTELPNPYETPANVPHGKTPRRFFAMAVMTICAILAIGMLIAQHFAIVEMQGIDIPILTKWFLHPAAAAVLFLGIVFVWFSCHWESKWWRTAVCILVLLFAFLWTAMFSLSMYLPIIAIRSGLGI